ncbi:MAG: Flp pilus assembly protein CpaB [Actinobacteria bacterium]|nr:Flp pilus assembly protein CpaB [Actinomycetota bacterium]
MNRRSGTVAAGGVIVALLGMLLVFVYAGQVRSGAGVSTGAGSAFVATTDIPVGSRFEDVAASLKKKDMPDDVLPSTAITAEDQLNGRSSVQNIAKGEIITSTQFNTSSTGGLDIPAGTNAVTINLGVPQGVARYIQPGAETNVYVTYKDRPDVGNGAESTVTQLVLSNVKVLANRPAALNVNQEQAEEAGQTAEILLTVAVTPDEAEKLIFAKENGFVWLGLVNPGDAPVASGGRTFSSALI